MLKVAQTKSVKGSRRVNFLLYERMHMRYEECPYCKRISASYWRLGNAAFFFNTDKKCPHCFGRLKLNLKSYLSIYMLAVFWLVLFFVVGYFFQDAIGNYGIIFLLFILLHILIYCNVALLSKFWCFRMLSPKDDVNEHMRNLPTYLK